MVQRTPHQEIVIKISTWRFVLILIAIVGVVFHADYRFDKLGLEIAKMREDNIRDLRQHEAERHLKKDAISFSP